MHLSWFVFMGDGFINLNHSRDNLKMSVSQPKWDKNAQELGGM